MLSSPPESFEEFRDRRQLAILKPSLAVGLAIIVVTALAHQILLSQSPLFWHDTIGLLFFGFSYYLAEQNKIAPKFSSLYLLLATIVMAGLSLWEEGQIMHYQLPYHYEMIYAACGLLFTRLSCLAAMYGVTFAGWSLFSSQVMPGLNSPDNLAPLAVAAMLGLGCSAIHRRLLLAQHELTKQEYCKQQELRVALHDDQLQREKLQLQQAAHIEELRELNDLFDNLKEQQAGLKQELMHCQAMDSIGRLASGLAHELNNTLTVVSGLLELNQEHLVRLPEGDELVGELKETLTRGGELAGRLVSVSGTMALQRRPVMVSQLLTTLKKLVGSHRLQRLIIDVPPDAMNATISVDEGAWLQTLSNLLVNAWDASSEDSPVRLTVEVALGEVFFRVSDRGSGVPEQSRTKIFEPYYTTKARGSGTGLGLAIAAGVVEKHGGELLLEKSDSSGSVFRASVPVVKADDTPQEQGAPVTVVERKLGARVLFVEDEEAILRVAKRHLDRLGFDVTATTQPREALSLLTRERYDVVVSDVVMPGLDGPGLIKQARETVPDLKVIFVSGYTDDRLRGTGMSQAGQAFLRKPYTIPDLASLIDKTIRD